MISFEINQQVGKKIPKTLWQKWLRKIAKKLNFKKKAEISVAIVDSSVIKKLNKIYRGRNQVTDVLSFSEQNRVSQKFRPPAKNYLGEVIICYPQTVKQAKKNSQPVLKEIELLFIHGVLHLLGYNHKKSSEAGLMRGLEQEILAKK